MNFINLFFIFSLGGKASFGQLCNDNLYSNLTVYNKFYISHFNFGLLIHFGVVTYSNLYNTKQNINNNNIKKINSDIYPGNFRKSYDNDINNIKMVKFNKSKGHVQLNYKGDKAQFLNVVIEKKLILFVLIDL